MRFAGADCEGKKRFWLNYFSKSAVFNGRRLTRRFFILYSLANLQGQPRGRPHMSVKGFGGNL